MIALALWRFLLRTPWSTFMAVLGVALGVTSIVSVHLISSTIAVRLDALIPSQLAGYSHFLHRDHVQASDYFALRRQWRNGRAPEIAKLAPFIDETMELSGRSVRVIGIDIFAAGTGLQLQRSSRETATFSWSGVWLDESLRESSGLPVNGVIDAPPGTLVADIAVAQELLGWPASSLSYVGAQLTDPLAATRKLGEKLLPGFGAGFPLSSSFDDMPSGWEVLSLAKQHPASQFGKSVLFNISALGLLALLVAWFLIYQVAVSWLRRLWPVFQRLHVLGVEWRVLRAYFVLLVAILGALSALIGLLTGQLLAQALYQLATGVMMDGLGIDAWVILKAASSAVGVCVLGGLWAFRQARQPSLKTSGPVWLAGGLICLAGFGITVPAAGLAGGFLSIAVLSALTALLVTPLLLKIRRFSPMIGGPYLVRLSVREAVWYPQDLGVALAGLTLAAATAIGVGLMVDSFRDDFSRMLEQRLSYDITAQGSHDELAKMYAVALTGSHIERVQAYKEAQIRIRGVPLSLVASQFDSTESKRYGLPRGLADGEALLSEQGARLLNVGVGDELLVADYPVKIAGVFASFGDIQPRLIVDDKHPAASLARDLTNVNLASSSADQLMVDLSRQFPALRLQLQSQLRRTALATFDQTFAITTVLIVIAMIVAGIGVYVAVTTLRLNKRAGSNLLNGMGVSRFESVGMDFALGLGIGVIAMFLAVPLGAAFGWILCSVINPRAFGWTVQLQFSLSAVATPIIWGLAAAACAGLIRVGRHEEGLGDVSH